MAEMKRYLRIDEVAVRFGVQPRTVRRWWLSGKTCLRAWHPDHRIGSKGLRFIAESVDEFESDGMMLPENYKEASFE
jgi:hypothetical protein